MNENCIKEAAYYLWQNAGCPSGQDEKFWSMAIEQLSSSGSKSKCNCTKKSCASSTSATKKSSSVKSSKSSKK